MKATVLSRQFTMNKNGSNINLPDPGSNYTPQQVLDFYSGTYPELTTSTVTGPVIINDEMVYTITTTLGTKG